MQNSIKLNTIYPVASHTNNIGPGSTFVAINGMKQNGVNFILDAINQGATKIVIQKDETLSQDILKKVKQKDIKLLYVNNTRKALSNLSAEALNYPSKSLSIIGITGTKGKSTTAYIVEHILKQSGFKTALLSSVNNRILDQDFLTNLTTPQPDYLHIFFDACKRAGIKYVVMEVAAQALSLNRADDIEFDAVIFTNFSLEHSEFYSNLTDYFSAKLKIFKRLKDNGHIILNADDSTIFNNLNNFYNLNNFNLNNLENICLYSINKQDLNTDFKAVINSAQNSLCETKALIKSLNSSFEIEVPSLIGTFNLYNILAAVSCVKKLNPNIGDRAVQKALKGFTSVPGRMNFYKLQNGALGVIDLAHNPQSFKEVLETLSLYKKNITIVFGAGGERDKIKRPLMGLIASDYANKILLTTDNPRSEDPKSIISDIISGIPDKHLFKVSVELDRETAINKAYELSDQSTIILLLGKGDEKYQLAHGKKNYFSEKYILSKFI